MVKMRDFSRIRALHAQGFSFSAISRELNVDRKTVRRYLRSNAPPAYGPRAVRCKTDPFEDFEEIVRGKMILAPKWTGAEIFEWVVGKGFKGSQRTVERRVQAIKGERPKERFFEQIYEPGHQAQFDFKETVLLPFTSGGHVVHIHVSTLPYSDMCVLKGYPQKTFECYIEGIHSFFEKIGGMPSVIRFDNLSPCVKKVLTGGRRIYTEAFDKAIVHYGFEVSPCNPGKGNEKGDVERDIQTYSRRFLNHVKVENLVFRDFDHLNEVLESFGSRFADQTKFTEEQKALLVTPPRDENILCRIEEHPASPFGLVRLEKSSYSVPDEAIGINCRIIGGPFTVTIKRLDNKKIVAEHPRMPDGQNSIRVEHIIGSLLRKPNAMVNWSHRGVIFPSPIFTKFYHQIRADKAIVNPQAEYLKAINLIQHTTMDEIAVGMDLVLQSAPHQGHQILEELRSLLLSHRRPTNIFDITERLGQKNLEPNLKQYDFLIPKGGAAEENIDSHHG